MRVVENNYLFTTPKKVISECKMVTVIKKGNLRTSWSNPSKFDILLLSLEYGSSPFITQYCTPKKAL